ncbi:hypothetical protein GGX14DRAFT_344704 [Mycena pura]|uniref:Tc1-like transposase DDE domain-containing protein n=1 Tax=Mycena pura TaxID=153505 RepID=A0AAD6YWB4_9AGAR|nr:hypothetical protein GGX14DRAFT_344704 [Mycena pura]
MVYKSHSIEVKMLALAAIDDGLDVATVERLFQVSRRSLERWDQQVRERLTLARKKSYLIGRPQTIPPDLLEVLRQLLDESPSLFLDEIAEYFAVVHAESFPISTICDTIKDLGFERVVLRRIAAQRDDDLRSEWMHFVLSHFKAHQMVFTDESSKDGRTLARRYVVEGSVNGEEFFDFILHDLLPKMNAFPQDNSVLIMDNCRIHKSEAVRQACVNAGALHVFLPLWLLHQLKDIQVWY